MSVRGVHKLVGKFQEPNTWLAKSHEQDLRFTSLTLYNSIIDALREGRGITCGISIIDKVIEVSDIIEETTLTKEKIGRLETYYYKQSLIRFYFREGSDYTGFLIKLTTSNNLGEKRIVSRMLR